MSKVASDAEMKVAGTYMPQFVGSILHVSQSDPFRSDAQPRIIRALFPHGGSGLSGQGTGM